MMRNLEVVMREWGCGVKFCRFVGVAAVFAAEGGVLKGVAYRPWMVREGKRLVFPGAGEVA